MRKPYYLFTALGLVAGMAQATGLTYLGQQIVPTGTVYAGTTVGGLSSLDYDAGNGRYLAISDDRSGFNPARFYALDLDLSKFQRSGTPGMAGVSFNAVTTIERPGGGAFALNQVDPEALRYDAARQRLYWTNEGQRSGAGFQDPTVREMTMNGVHVRDFTVPGRFRPVGSNAGNQPGDRGIVNNLAFESLAMSPDGRTLWTATENALAQDGPVATVSNGSRVRFLSFDIASGASGAEYAYDVGPVALPPAVPGGFATNGLTDIIAIGERRWITIERSFAVGAQTPGQPVTGNTIRLFLADATAATDVSGLDGLAGQAVTAMTKTLLLDLSDLKNDDGSTLALDNIEGITMGPMFNGLQTLLLVSDNNFSGTQFTQFVALSIQMPIPEPGTWLLLGLGAPLMLLRVRRRNPTAT
ncbi:MAG: esterase-like activity of phytase family protein [Aquabacterium sp.]